MECWTVFGSAISKVESGFSSAASPFVVLELSQQMEPPFSGIIITFILVLYEYFKKITFNFVFFGPLLATSIA